MVRLAQQGRIETIMSHKTMIDLNSLLVTEQPLVLLPPPPPPRVVLIEGPPGGGKSTLAFYICKQWAQGASFLSRFDVVVIAYLRDQPVSRMPAPWLTSFWLTPLKCLKWLPLR